MEITKVKSGVSHKELHNIIPKGSPRGDPTKIKTNGPMNIHLGAHRLK